MEDTNLTNNQPDTERMLAEAREEAKTNLAGWQRAQADFENYKKREESKQKELIEFAREVAVTKMLPPLDSLEQGLKQMPTANDSEFANKFTQWKTGIDGVLQKLAKALEEMNVKKIEALGKPFDPNYHEAVREVPSEQNGIVVEELQSGYEINGKVIRPSQVVIGRKA